MSNPEIRQRKKRTGSDKLTDAELAPFLKLIGQIVEIKKQAFKEYKPIVEKIIRSNSQNTRHIEHTLDRLLDFADYGPCLQLYRRLCRHDWEIDPNATARYVQVYRQMWDSDD